MPERNEEVIHKTIALLRRRASGEDSGRHDMDRYFHPCGSPSCLAGELCWVAGYRLIDDLDVNDLVAGPGGVVRDVAVLASELMGVEDAWSFSAKTEGGRRSGIFSSCPRLWPAGYDLSDPARAADFLQDLLDGKFDEDE